MSLASREFDESIPRASKGIRQLQETARRLKKRFSASSPEYSFRLRDLVEAIRSLALTYRDTLPEPLLDMLWTSHAHVHLHLEEREISFYLALYQMKDQEDEVQKMCEQNSYRLLKNEHNPFQQLNGRKGERVCVYRSAKGVGLAFEQFILQIAGDEVIGV